MNNDEERLTASEWRKRELQALCRTQGHDWTIIFFNGHPGSLICDTCGRGGYRIVPIEVKS